MAYWLLTGQLVFTADTPMALADAARADPPVAAVGPDRNCRFPPRSTALILSCLAKDPAERPQSARELSQRLAEIDGADAWTQDRARELVGGAPARVRR